MRRLIVISLVAMLAGCGQRIRPTLPSEPSHPVAGYTVETDGYYSTVTITEFRDSRGRICVMATASRAAALDCDTQIPGEPE